MSCAILLLPVVRFFKSSNPIRKSKVLFVPVLGLTHSEVFCDKWWLVPKTHERICLIRSDVQVLFCDRALCASMVYVNPTLSITHTHTFSSNCFFWCNCRGRGGGDEIDWHFHLWIGAPAKCHLKSSFFRVLESGFLGLLNWCYYGSKNFVQFNKEVHVHFSLKIQISSCSVSARLFVLGVSNGVATPNMIHSAYCQSYDLLLWPT